MFADIVENRVPVKGKLEVAHRPVGGPFGVLLVGQDDGGGNGYAEFCAQGVVEKLVVCGPPEGIVHDDGAVESGVLEIGAIEGNVVGDAVDDDRVTRGAVEIDGAGLNKLGLNALDVTGVDVLDQCAGETVLHAEQDADLLHAASTSGDNPRFQCKPEKLAAPQCAGVIVGNGAGCFNSGTAVGGGLLKPAV